MKSPFQPGDQKTFTHVVTANDFAVFASGQVHDVYATFSVARDAEWSGRLFVLEMKDEDEEGIGTGITVEHHSPAVLHDAVVFIATFVSLIGNEITTEYEAKVGTRLIAKGIQQQKIVKKEKLKKLFEHLKKG